MLILLCPPRLTPRSMAITTVMAISFLQRQIHGLAGCGGGAGGIEYFHRNEVGFKGSQVIWFRTIYHYAAEFRQRIIIGRDQSFRLDGPLLFCPTPHPQVVPRDGNDVSLLSIDFHVFAIERPVPRGLNDRNCFGIL